MYASIFGESPETQKARENRDNTFQSMLASRRQAAEQARTDNVAMARYNALGNVITSMAQLGGWAAGGGTSDVQKYDDRQYLNAFNRAVQASDDLRNIGNADAEYRFKLADEDYRRAMALEDEERRRKQANEDYERKRRIAMQEDEAREKARMDRLQQEYDLRAKLAETQAAGQIAIQKAKAATKSSGKTTKKDEQKAGNRIRFAVPTAAASPKDERLER
jgi:hypothetical protein